MRRIAVLAAVLVVPVVLIAQSAPPPQPDSDPTLNTRPTLTINSRAVLVDVIVTDSHGNPITGINRDAFSVTEEGKPQAISFFEEHRPSAQPPQPITLPKLPPNVFSNFSPYPDPPAVNMLLLDSLNTHMENQSYVHAQALKFLKSAKPGSRMAIFAMGLGLHFIQGFTDDPALLAAALSDKKNTWVQASEMIKGQDETNAQQNVLAMMSAPEGNGATAASAGSISALQNFFQENDDSRSVDRAMLTLANFERLATFLNSFPGRKNVIWFSESFPVIISGVVDPQVGGATASTLNMLAASRVALYPVDARGVSNYSLYEASNNLSHAYTQASQIVGPTGAFSNSLTGDNQQRDSDQETMKQMAEQTGGKAFVNANGLAQVIGDVASSGGDFYSLSYSPSNIKMDGAYRKIEVKVQGGNYHLSYRRGYVALDDALPGSGEMLRAAAFHQVAAKNPGAVDPLLPFMDLGMPQSEQILYKARIQPLPVGSAPQPNDPKAVEARYGVDFAIDLKDLRLPQGGDGLHAGTLNISLIAYDRYGNIVSRKDHRVELHVKPDVWTVYQNTGVQLHAEIAVPKGQYWLRTGIFDEQSRKVGTMELPLSSVQPVQTANSDANRTGK